MMDKLELIGELLALGAVVFYAGKATLNLERINTTLGDMSQKFTKHEVKFNNLYVASENHEVRLKSLEDPKK